MLGGNDVPFYITNRCLIVVVHEVTPMIVSIGMLNIGLWLTWWYNIIELYGVSSDNNLDYIHVTWCVNTYVGAHVCIKDHLPFIPLVISMQPSLLYAKGITIVFNVNHRLLDMLLEVVEKVKCIICGLLGSITKWIPWD